MKFIKDCVRDILMYVEKYSVYETNNLGYKSLHIVNFDELCHSDLIKGDNDIIQYALEKMEEYRLIKFTDTTSQNSSIIDDGFKNYSIAEITNHGHEFLDNVKNPDDWNQMKLAMEKANVDDCSLNLYYEYIYNIVRKRLNE